MKKRSAGSQSGLCMSSSSCSRQPWLWQNGLLLAVQSLLVLLSASSPAKVVVVALLTSDGGIATRAVGQQRWGVAAPLVACSSSITATGGRGSASMTKQRLPALIVPAVSVGNPCHRASRTTTSLGMLLDVPDGFFTVTFPVLGILLSLSRNFARIRIEENAWEQRLAEGRTKLLAEDPTLTELDLRRMEAAQEWSAYGKPRMMREKQRIRRQEELERSSDNNGGSRVRRQRRGTAAVDDLDSGSTSSSSHREGVMSTDEIADFEATYGVEYDPYYDDPYREDELPSGKYRVDKRYGDRVYEDGEVFYRTSQGLYYRQGAKPRSIQFW